MLKSIPKYNVYLGLGTKKGEGAWYKVEDIEALQDYYKMCFSPLYYRLAKININLFGDLPDVSAINVYKLLIGAETYINELEYSDQLLRKRLKETKIYFWVSSFIALGCIVYSLYR